MTADRTHADRGVDAAVTVAALRAILGLGFARMQIALWVFLLLFGVTTVLEHVIRHLRDRRRP